MKKGMTGQKDIEAQQGLLFPELVRAGGTISKQKTERKNGARRQKAGETDSQFESMSPNEFAEFLRNRDKSRYEKARLNLQEENDK